MDHRLTKLQRNQILHLIERDMSRDEFTWEEKTFREESSKERHTIHVLWHVSTKFFYEFGNDYETFSPGEFSRVETIHVRSDKRIPWVMTWISRLKKEIEAPDLWAAHLNDVQIRNLVVASDVSNAKFSEAEKEKIVRLLQDLKQKVLEIADLQNDQNQRLDAIDGSFDYLKSAADRLGRKDWLMTAISTVISIAVNAVLPGDTANSLLHGFIAAVGPIVTGGVRLIL